MVDPNRLLEEIPLEQEELEKEPKGENNLSSFAMFNERKKYKNQTYPLYTVPTPYDLWYDKSKNYFGKLDENGYSMVVREKYLKQTTGSVNAFAFDFVVDAYNGFKEKYTFLNKKNSDNSAFKELNIKSGWRSAPVEYNDYLDGIFNLFVNDFMSKEKRDQKMIDFNSFIKLFYEFISDMEGNAPITFSKFIKSSFCSPQSSGLMLELTTDPHGNDKDKYNNFIKNINFECYARTAAEFGFRIDKNYPGRIIADVKSFKMQEYMGTYPKPPRNPLLDENGNQIPPPNPPVFELPDVSTPELDTPWAQGDTVEAIIIRPEDPSTEPYYVIGGYTNDRNQKFGSGVRPIINDQIDEIKQNAFQYMVDELLEAGRATKVFFKLLNNAPDPSITNPPPSKSGTWKTSIIGIENSFQGGINNFFSSGFSGTEFYYIDYESLLLYNLSSRRLTPYNRELLESPFESSGVVYMRQLPIKSMHLSNAVQQPSSTIKRFERYFQEREDINVQREKLREYRTFVYEPLYQKYEQELEIYEKTQKKYESDLNIYNLAPKPMSYYNFIDLRYNLGYRVDVDMLKELMLQFYYSYSSSRPTVFIKESINCGGNTPRTKSRILPREQISHRIIDEKYGDRRIWIRTYAEVKRLEMKKRMKIGAFNKILYSTISLYNSKGEETALRYLTDEFKKYS